MCREQVVGSKNKILKGKGREMVAENNIGEKGIYFLKWEHIWVYLFVYLLVFRKGLAKESCQNLLNNVSEKWYKMILAFK